MRRVFALLERVAGSDATILIEGETGTGKSVLAEAIHEASPRAQRPFVVVDCGALPHHLLESELFGHERGAFTGAVSTRIGLFESADGGTVLLDEIGELPLDLQPKLLRALERRVIRRVGSSRETPIDVRLIAATHRDLRCAVNQKTFRSDLWYRLNTVRVVVPPLRERRDDIVMLVAEIYRELSGDPAATPPAEVVRMLMRGMWHGNVRELRSAVERSLIGTPPIEYELARGSSPEMPFKLGGALSQALKGYLKLPKEAFKNLSVESVHFDKNGGELRRRFRSLRLLKLKSFNPGRSISRLRARYQNDPKFRGKVGAGLKSVGKAGLAILASLVAEYFIGKWIESIEDKMIRQDIERRAPEVEAAIQKSLDDQSERFDALYEANPETEVHINIRYRIVHVELRDPEFTTNSYAGLELVFAEVSQTAIEEGVKYGGSSMCIGSTQRYQDLSMSEAVKLSDLYAGVDDGEDDKEGDRGDKAGAGTKAAAPGKQGGNETP